MKLVKIDLRGRSRLATISFSKNGIISLSQEACQMLALNETDSIDIFKDEHNLNDFYIQKSDKPLAEAKLRKNNTSKACKGLSINSIYACEAIVGYGNAAKYRISPDSIEYEGGGKGLPNYHPQKPIRP